MRFIHLKGLATTDSVMSCNTAALSSVQKFVYLPKKGNVVGVSYFLCFIVLIYEIWRIDMRPRMLMEVP